MEFRGKNFIFTQEALNPRGDFFRTQERGVRSRDFSYGDTKISSHRVAEGLKRSWNSDAGIPTSKTYKLCCGFATLRENISVSLCEITYLTQRTK